MLLGCRERKKAVVILGLHKSRTNIDLLPAMLLRPTALHSLENLVAGKTGELLWEVLQLVVSENKVSPIRGKNPTRVKGICIL